MSESTTTSSIRGSNGLRAVDSLHRYGTCRKHRDVEHKSAPLRPTRNSARQVSRLESTQRRQETLGHCTKSNILERTTLNLDVLEQPPKSIAIGTAVATSVMIGLQCPAPEVVASLRNMDTSRFMAAVSLVVDTRSGERMPIEHGYLTGQNIFDTVHPIPQPTAESLARSQPCRLTLGYFSFPNLKIRQLGAYRLRVTLFKNTHLGTLTIVATDSDVIKVERSCGGDRKQQRS